MASTHCHLVSYREGANKGATLDYVTCNSTFHGHRHRQATNRTRSSAYYTTHSLTHPLYPRAMSRTPAQTDALEQLWAITASETEAARARDERLLRENNWDIQVRGSCAPSFLV